LRLSKEGLWIVVGQLLAIVGSLVGVRLLTGMLDPAMYGELALGMSVATLINQSVMGPLANSATRFFAPAHEDADTSAYLSSVRRLLMWATVVIVLIIPVALAGLWLSGHLRWTGIFLIALAFAIFSGYNSILSGIQNAARQRAVVALHQGAESWVRYIIAAALIVWLGASSTVAMSGYVVAALLVLVSQWIYFRPIIAQRTENPVSHRHWDLEIWRFMWPISFWGVFTFAQQTSDRWALAIFSSTHEVGMYAALFQLGDYPISVLTGIAVQFLAPIFFKRAGDARDDKRNASVSVLSLRLSGLALGVTFIAFIAAIPLHELVFHVFVAKEYAAVSYLFPWVLLAGGVFAAGQIMSLNLMSRMKTNVLMTAKVVTAVVGLALNFIGAYLYGITGIVVTACLFSFLFFGWMLVVSRRIQAKSRGSK